MIKISLFIMVMAILTFEIASVNSPKKIQESGHPIEQNNSGHPQSIINKGSILLPSSNSKEYNLNSLSISFKTAPYKQNNISSYTLNPYVSMLINPSMYFKSSNLTTDKLEDFCSTKVSDFFNGLENTDSLQQLFDNKQIFDVKDIDQRLFENASLSSIYGGRNLFKIRYLVDNTIYTIKGFQKSQYKHALKELIFYKTVIKKKVDDRNAFGLINGCLFDNDRIYILMEKNKEYESLSDGNMYNRLRNLHFMPKLNLLGNLSNSVRLLHKAGYSHNMISPDSFLIDFENMVVKLIHFENCTQGSRPLKHMSSLVGTIVEERDEPSVLFQSDPNTKKIVNNDLYALVKVMIHLDSTFYESRLDEQGNEKLDKIDHASYDSIIELYQNNNYPNAEKLLEFIHSKCETVESQDSGIGSIITYPIEKLFSFIKGNDQPLYNCKSFLKIYEDVLNINSPSFIENADSLVKRIELTMDTDKYLRSTVNINLKNFGKTSVILPSKSNIMI